MIKKFIGKYDQIVTELNKCYCSGREYNLTENELIILAKRNMMFLFVDIEDDKKKKEAK